jgi:rRNA maturation endonuclease Nob1
MEKYYCTNCMQLLNQNQLCKRCGNKVINKIEINVQTHHPKKTGLKKESDS